jgi:hypothetical protein
MSRCPAVLGVFIAELDISALVTAWRQPSTARECVRPGPFKGWLRAVDAV